MSFFILLCLPSSIEMSHIAFLNALWLIVQPLWVLKHLNERMCFGTEDVKTHEIETFLICCSQERFVLSQTGKMSLQDLLGREAKWSYLFDWPSKQHSDAVLFWACIPLLFSNVKNSFFSVPFFISIAHCFYWKCSDNQYSFAANSNAVNDNVYGNVE